MSEPEIVVKAEPTTQAGRALLTDYFDFDRIALGHMRASVLAIEVEARADERKRNEMTDTRNDAEPWRDAPVEAWDETAQPPYAEPWRPPFCPDRTCTPLIRPLTDSDNKGLSADYAVFCFGRLAEPIDWTFAGVEHHETLSQCQSSPLKGNVRWLDNEADWDALAETYRMAWRKAKENR